MRPGGHAGVGTLLGSAALGILTGAEAARVERHVIRCRGCRTELAYLRAVARTLGGLSLEETAVAFAPSPAFVAGLSDAVITRVADEQQVERRRRVAVKAIIVVIVAVFSSIFIIGLGARQDRPASSRQGGERVAVSTTGGVSAVAELIEHPWGMEIRLQVAGLVEGQRYRVEVLDRQGVSQSAGTFLGVGDRVMKCILSSSVLRPQATSFAVVDAAGREVISSGSMTSRP